MGEGRGGVGLAVGDTPVTLMELLVPVMKVFTVSVAVIVQLPKVWRVAVKVPMPFCMVLSGGNSAAGSELVKCIVPE